MWPYWLMLFPPSVGALLEGGRGTVAPTARTPAPFSAAWAMAIAGITIVIGYRTNVGSDWWNYLDHLEAVRGVGLSEVLTLSDPGYKVGNWLSNQLDGGIYAVNLLCGVLLSLGLVSFCRTMPRPWLALAVAIPYLVIVVGMGYSRQAVALGTAMLGLVAQQRKSTVRFVFWVLLGATFHKTAVLLLPITALANTENRYWTVLWVGAVTAGAYVLFLEDSVDALYSGYIEAEYHSEGALVRLLMNALPASILLIKPKLFNFQGTTGALWRWFAIISIVLLGVLFVSPSSTAVDRIALYMLPLQLVVFSSLPEVFGTEGDDNQGWTILVVGYYASVLFVWLNFASHARAWLPYRFMPFEVL